MSVFKGQWLGGITTLEQLRERCHITPLGCWVWKASTFRDGAAKVCIRVRLPGPEAPGHLCSHHLSMRGRRAALILSGVDLHSKQVAFETPNCVTASCCNPEHSRVGTWRDWNIWRTESGQARTPARVASAVDAVLGRRKLTEAQVLEVHASTGRVRAIDLARKFGVGVQIITGIRRGTRYREYLPPEKAETEQELDEAPIHRVVSATERTMPQTFAPASVFAWRPE